MDTVEEAPDARPKRLAVLAGFGIVVATGFATIAAMAVSGDRQPTAGPEIAAGTSGSSEQAEPGTPVPGRDGDLPVSAPADGSTAASLTLSVVPTSARPPSSSSDDGPSGSRTGDDSGDGRGGPTGDGPGDGGTGETPGNGDDPGDGGTTPPSTSSSQPSPTSSSEPPSPTDPTTSPPSPSNTSTSASPSSMTWPPTYWTPGSSDTA